MINTTVGNGKGSERMVDHILFDNRFRHQCNTRSNSYRPFDGIYVTEFYDMSFRQITTPQDIIQLREIRKSIFKTHERLPIELSQPDSFPLSKPMLRMANKYERFFA